MSGVNIKKFCYSGEGKFKLASYPTDAGIGRKEKEHYQQLTAENTAAIAALQDKLYAQGTEGVIFAIQAMDAAGKDSTIRKVMSGVNPQGVKVTSFKSPTSTELSHDYLWRVNAALPGRGYIGIFNRSHYEDVLAVRVHGYWKKYKWPLRCQDMDEDEFFAKRFKAISAWEEHLYDNGFRMVKIFLNVGLDAQCDRFVARIDEEAKNWKFSAGDLDERDLWPEYMHAYEEAIKGTATKHCPWYIVPADRKWMTQYIVSCIIRKTLEDMAPEYPTMPAEEQATLAECRERLVGKPAEAAEEAEATEETEEK